MVGYVDKAMERYPLQMKIVVRFGIYQIEDRTIDVTVMYDRAVLAVKRIKENTERHTHILTIPCGMNCYSKKRLPIPCNRRLPMENFSFIYSQNAI